MENPKITFRPPSRMFDFLAERGAPSIVARRDIDRYHDLLATQELPDDKLIREIAEFLGRIKNPGTVEYRMAYLPLHLRERLAGVDRTQYLKILTEVERRVKGGIEEE